MSTIAEISPARTWRSLVMTLIYLAVLATLGSIVILDLMSGRGVELWMVLLLAAAALTARGIAEQVFLFLAMFHGRGALWLDGQSLVYLSGLFSKTNLADIADVRVENRRRGFGKLPYLVLTLSGGKRLFVSLDVCKGSSQDILQDIADLGR